MKSIFILALLLILIQSVLGDEYRRIYIFYSNDVHGGITEQEADFLNLRQRSEQLY